MRHNYNSQAPEKWAPKKKQLNTCRHLYKRVAEEEAWSIKAKRNQKFAKTNKEEKIIGKYLAYIIKKKKYILLSEDFLADMKQLDPQHLVNIILSKEI